jgi:hypothetical protein
MQEPPVVNKLVPMMTLSQVIAAAKSMVRVNSEMVNAVAFGPDAHDRQSGALMSLALLHLDTMTKLLVPEVRRWPSAFALSRVAADAALRSVYLGFGDTAPNFARRYKAFVEDKPNPFGGPKDLLGEIREAFKTYPAFVTWRGANSEPDEPILSHVEVDWGVLSSFTHSGEIQTRFVLHEVSTGEPPHEKIQTRLLFATTRFVTECVSIVLAQRNEPQRGGFVAVEFIKSFPPEQMD